MKTIIEPFLRAFTAELQPVAVAVAVSLGFMP